MGVRLLLGDAAEQIRTLEPESIHTCVTSPPYYNLRDYGVAGQIGMEGTRALADLAAEYEHSRLLIKGRMSELRSQFKDAQDQNYKHRLAGRLSALKAVYRDTQAIAKLLKHYYERGFYRDGRYCLQRDGAAARSRSSSVPKTDRRNERGSDPPAQEKFDGGNRAGPDGPTAADVVDVLFRGPIHAKHRQ